MHFILASASPRRRDILSQIGISFEVQVSHCEESMIGMDLAIAARLLAEKKALWVSERHLGVPVLGYDTLVYLDEQPLGKPENEAHARQMLSLLRGRWHQVKTGVALAISGKLIQSDIELADVQFRTFTDHEMDDYISSKDPLDKAGAYGIQGPGARLVQSIRGCFYAIAGLPIAKTLEMIQNLETKINVR